jgi:hypothetical protein
LNSPETSNAAAHHIVQVVKDDPEAREYITERLPDVIDKAELDRVWLNAVRLSGRLRAANSVVPLIRVLPRSPYKQTILTFGTAWNLDSDPVVNRCAKLASLRCQRSRTFYTAAQQWTGGAPHEFCGTSTLIRREERCTMTWNMTVIRA